MKISRRRVLAIYRKELREYRRNRSIVAGMAIFPLLFVIQPLITAFTLPASSAGQLVHHHELLYLLAIPAIVPATLAAYAVVGERQQGTLEPVLATPIRREEFLLGKAIAVLAPSIAISYVVFALFAA
jgi:ABC-2 type transport system permease protein